MHHKTIKVLLLPVGRPPEVQEVRNDLDSFQRLVGGFIEHVSLAPDVDLWCNEEGKINGLPPNRCLRSPEGEIYDVLVGDCFLTGHDDEGEAVSLTPEQITEYTTKFSQLYS